MPTSTTTDARDARPAAPAEGRWHEAERQVADAVGRLMEFWGFRRHLGRVWTVLYLSPAPLAVADLAERVQLSQSAMSLTLGELGNWGAVKKTRLPGERRDYFQAETSIWKLVTRVMRQRELRLVGETAEALDRAEALLDEARKQDELSPKELRFVRKRLGRLRLLTNVGERVLGSFLSGRAVDVDAVRKIAEPRA